MIGLGAYANTTFGTSKTHQHQHTNESGMTKLDVERIVTTRSCSSIVVVSNMKRGDRLLHLALSRRSLSLLP